MAMMLNTNEAGELVPWEEEEDDEEAWTGPADEGGYRVGADPANIGPARTDQPMFVNEDEAEFERWLDDIIGRGLSYRPDLDAAIRPGTGEVVERAPLGYAKA
jgi:hypothetical protein